MPISRAISRSSSGFTLIEMNFVIVLLMILAVMIVPSVLAIQRSRALSDLEAAITRLPLEARNDARTTQQPVELQIQGDALVMSRVSDTSSTTEVKRVTLNSDIHLDQAQLNGKSSDLGSWRWTVYPDGSCDRGGLEFTEGSLRKSLLLADDGSIRWVRAALPDASEDRWEAGQLEKRQ